MYVRRFLSGYLALWTGYGLVFTSSSRIIYRLDEMHGRRDLHVRFLV